MSTNFRGQYQSDPARHVIRLLHKDHLGPDVVGAISGMGAAVIPLLGRIATGEQAADEYERENAIYVLGLLGQKAAVDYLRQVLWSPDLNLQVQAARALGRIGTPDALAELQSLYKGYRAPAPLPVADRAKEPRPAALSRAIPAPLALELRDILDSPEKGSDGHG